MPPVISFCLLSAGKALISFYYGTDEPAPTRTLTLISSARESAKEGAGGRIFLLLLAPSSLLNQGLFSFPV